MTLHQAGKEATKEKKLRLIQQKFVELTEVEDWKTATSEFPAHTSEETLNEFIPYFELTANECKWHMLQFTNVIQMLILFNKKLH